MCDTHKNLAFCDKIGEFHSDLRQVVAQSVRRKIFMHNCYYIAQLHKLKSQRPLCAK